MGFWVRFPAFVEGWLIAGGCMGISKESYWLGFVNVGSW